MGFLPSLDDYTIWDEPLDMDMHHSLPHKIPLDNFMVLSSIDQPLSLHFINNPSINEAMISFVHPSPKSPLVVE